MDAEKTREIYDKHYSRSNHYRYRDCIYRPFVRALLKKSGLRQGNTILDAGCGQGFFTALFANSGLNATGIDISPAGIRAAEHKYASTGARFAVGDILHLDYAGAFDCVFTRSCSLYNTHSFTANHLATDTLLAYVKPRGTLIFDYYSRLDSTAPGESWIYHSLADARRHFSRYANFESFFSIRIDTSIFGAKAFSKPVTRLAASFSRWFGIGGELIVIVSKI